MVWYLGDSRAQLPPTVAAMRKQLAATSIDAVPRSEETQDLRRALNAGVDGLALESRLHVVLPATVRSACVGQLSVPRGPTHTSSLPSRIARSR